MNGSVMRRSRRDGLEVSLDDPLVCRQKETMSVVFWIVLAEVPFRGFLADLLFEFCTGWNVLKISSHSMSAGRPSILTSASKEITSDSEEECETAPCFLHIHPIGTKVQGPIRTRKPPEVDLLSLMSPAKLASTNSTSEQSRGQSPTKLN